MKNLFTLKNLNFLFAITIAVVLISCSDSNDPAEDPNEIKIGVLLCKTGTGASNAEETEAAINIALNEINLYFQNTSSKLKFKLVIEDTKTDTNVCLEKLKSFKEKKIKFVVGPYTSAELAAIKDYANQNEMLLLSHSAVAISLAIPNDNVYRMAPCDSLQAKAITKMLNFSGITALVSLIRNDLWGKELNAATQSLFIQQGGRANSTVSFGPNNTYGFEDIVSLVDGDVRGLKQNYNYNDLEIGCYFLSMDEGVKYLRLVKNYNDLKQVRWFGGSAFAMNKQVLQDTDAAEFCYHSQLTCPIFALDPNAENRWSAIKNLIKSRIGREPSAYAINAYDALWLYALAYGEAGKDAEFAALKQAFLTKSNNYDGASGKVKFDANGDRTNVNYDFWGVEKNESIYFWEKRAEYNTSTDELLILK